MNKLIKSLLLGACLTGSLWAEQKVIIVMAASFVSESTKEVNSYLDKGWEVVKIERGSGGSDRSYWLVIIEKKEIKVEKKD
jgi:hypothetical protein